MSTSNSYNYSQTRDQLITKAFQLINVYAVGATPSSDDISYANDILNMMIKTWQAEGIKLWKRKIGYLFTALDTASYQLGSVSGANHCSGTYVATTLSSTASLGASSVALTSVTGMSASDFIGIELDDGTRQWTTISGSPSTSSTSLAATLTGAASSGNTVITYTSKINRPLEVIRGTIIDLDSSSTETQLDKISHDDYFNLPVKTTAGKANNFYYDRVINNSLPYTGVLYLYPRPNNVAHIVAFTYLDGLQDFDSSSDDADFPQEWYYPIVVNLAAELGLHYGKFAELEKIDPKARELKEIVKGFDGDDENLSFGFHTMNRF